jgi:hypothetical protein
MHREKTDYLTTVITSQEAAQLWGLTRNAVLDAIKRGALRARQSSSVWLVTVEDMVRYKRGAYWPDNLPPELLPVVKEAAQKYMNE